MECKFGIMTCLMDLSKLLSGIVDAAHYGASTIRGLSLKARTESIHFKEQGEVRSAMTIADIAAQKIIVSSLKDCFPSLQIIGEEDDTVQIDRMEAVELRLDLDLDFAEGVYPIDMDPIPTLVDNSDIVVFVDPLDGTREFIEGRFENVQCLIGVCYKNIPFMAAISLPFVKESDNIEIFYGMVGKGIGKRVAKPDRSIEKTKIPKLETYSVGDPIFLTSGDSKSMLLQESLEICRSVLPNSQHQILGACGNKLIQVMLGKSTLAIMHNKTSLWDTCAPSALLHAVGCNVTDLLGGALDYSTRDFANKLGIVASTRGAGKLHEQATLAIRHNHKIMGMLGLEPTVS
jgi:3'-phosphoadenosine 5'-phosphosulfate (PAPS) 3'-phosphatase